MKALPDNVKDFIFGILNTYVDWVILNFVDVIPLDKRKLQINLLQRVYFDDKNL